MIKAHSFTQVAELPQCSRKFVTIFERLKSFEVDSSRHATGKSSQVESGVLKSTAVDLESF